jgi:hypothetical protein
MTSLRRTRTQGPKHLFLLPTIACLVGAILLLRNPEPLDRISYVIFGGRPPGTAAADSTIKPAAKPPAPAKVKKPSTSASRPSNVETTEPVVAISETPAADAVPLSSEAPPAKPDPLHAIVKTDSAEAYSSSSETSPVVFVLNKGAQVETTLELVNSEGRWTMVRAEDSKRSAYVRSEHLQRATR